MMESPFLAPETAERLARQHLLNARCHGAWVAAETKRILDAFKVHDKATP